MSILKREKPEETDNELRRWLSSSGLSGDSSNVWTNIPTAVQVLGDVNRLFELETYEEYIRACGVHTPEEAERLIAMSDPDSIRQFNELVAEYNADLPRIKEEDDRQTAIDFYNRADKLIRREQARTVLLGS